MIRISAFVISLLLVGTLKILGIQAFCTPRFNFPFLTPATEFRVESTSIKRSSSLQARISNLNQPFDDDEFDEDDDDDEEEDIYSQLASSEFDEEASTTSLDWGSALGSLRQRVGDIEQGKSKNPSNVLFRLMTSESPNQAIGKFVKEANPEILSAMSGAVTGLLGGLSNPSMGIDTVVKANGEKVASLCFQLQMTGYMFRNAEYVVALKDLMKIKRGASVDQFKSAFDRLDVDQSGYIEAAEVSALFTDVYDGEPPSSEIRAFLRYFDSNKDGRISWEEFERGLGAMSQDAAAVSVARSLPGFGISTNEDSVDSLNQLDEEEEDMDALGEPNISGVIEVELEDGKVIEVEANEYIESLKQEAESLKEALRLERGESSSESSNDEISPGTILNGQNSLDDTNSKSGGISSLIASLGGDLRQLTEGISPEIVDTMRLLVDFVLEGRDKRQKKKVDLEQDMELPGSALQQLALWQLILGYRLREAEATGDYKRLLDN